jgi:translation initiation factor IF-2
VGPKILGIAEPVKPLPTVKAAAPVRKRRRRPSAAERHRRAFFSALTDLRRGAPAATPAPDAQAEDAPAAEAPATPDAEAAEQPAADAPVAEAPPAEPQGAPEPPAAPVDRSPSTPARVTAAIERVGGAEVIKEALKPKQDEKGQPLKWAAVCAQAAEGLKPGDPVFNAWVRLAATPVRDVKSQLPRPAEQERGGRPGEAGGRRPGGARAGGDRGGRPRRDDRPSRQEFASHAQDGTLRKSIRIVTGHDEDQERRERERMRKEQREAKRRAERERLARLGY